MLDDLDLLLIIVLYVVFVVVSGWMLMTITGYLFHVDFSWGIALMMGFLFSNVVVLQR